MFYIYYSLLKGQFTQNKNYHISIIYSFGSCSKPVWIYYFCWTQKKDILNDVCNRTVDGPHW